MENTFTCQVRKVGGSLMVTIPKSTVKLMNIGEGMIVDVKVMTDTDRRDE